MTAALPDFGLRLSSNVGSRPNSGLPSRLSKVRSWVFIDGIDEVTRFFEGVDVGGPAGHEDAAATLPELQVMLEGVFEHRRFLDLIAPRFPREALRIGTLGAVVGVHDAGEPVDLDHSDPGS